MPRTPEIPERLAPLGPAWGFHPADALRRWPAPVALAAVALPSWAGVAGRWTLLTRADPSCWRHADLAGVFDLAPTAFPAPDAGHAGWLFAIDYEAGFAIEPTAARAIRPSPHAAALPYTDALLHHAESNRWFALGDARVLPDLAALPARHETWRAGRPRPAPGQGRDWYRAAVARCVELIRAGDLFQANLSHRLECPFEGSARALFAALLERTSPPPPHAAYLELPHRTVVSASPELFLEADFDSGRVSTRPIKGTRRAELAGQLEDSEKDRAELVMITDLMRNDLGRVARFGTVRVDDPRRYDRHGPIVHASAAVSALMRRRPRPVTPLELMHAAFPPGSITGAPKVRAMQVIDELEQSTPRGIYCGTIGHLAASGHSTWSVAIRTATIAGGPPGTLAYPVGAGIVEGSDPELEWQETLHKAEEFISILMNPPAAPVAPSGPRPDAARRRARVRS